VFTEFVVHYADIYLATVFKYTIGRATEAVITVIAE
jgi:hypothetical protein